MLMMLIMPRASLKIAQPLHLVRCHPHAPKHTRQACKVELLGL